MADDIQDATPISSNSFCTTLRSKGTSADHGSPETNKEQPSHRSFHNRQAAAHPARAKPCRCSYRRPLNSPQRQTHGRFGNNCEVNNTLPCEMCHAMAPVPHRERRFPFCQAFW